jgi:hypothetical protein
MNITILLQLLLAHFLNDFVIQRDKWVQNKIAKGLKSPYFWAHTLLAGLITYLFLMMWTVWTVPLFIMISHGIIDYWKISSERKIAIHNEEKEAGSKKKSGTREFFLDQILHILIILIAWVYLTRSFDEVIPFLEALLSEEKYIIIIAAVIFLIWPAGVAIEKITEPFKNEISSLEDDESLSKAGTYIGIFERLMVLIFILTGQFAAIGFLIAAKSILRISRNDDKNARKKTEYVLIGTLISFTVAIVVGLITKSIIT